jgi:hypothetical protein
VGFGELAGHVTRHLAGALALEAEAVARPPLPAEMLQVYTEERWAPLAEGLPSPPAATRPR